MKIRLFRLLGILFIGQVVNTNKCFKKVSPCRCQVNDTHEIDLRSLADHLATEADALKATGGLDQFDYQYSPCKSIKCGSHQGVAVCQSYSKFGIHIRNDVGQLASAEFDHGSHGYYGYRHVFSSLNMSQRSIVELYCDMSTNLLYSADGARVHGGRDYYMQVTSKYVCPLRIQIPQPRSTKTPISIGTILLIVLLCSVVLYIGIGSGVNAIVFHKRHWQIIPHATHVQNLVLHIRDGCITYRATYRSVGTDVELPIA